MLHSLRIYLSIPEVFFIFFEGTIVAVNVPLASRFHLNKAEVFEVFLEFEVAVWSFLGLKVKEKIHLKKHLTSRGALWVSQQISLEAKPLPKSNPKDKSQFQTTTTPSPTLPTPAVSRGVENWHLENKFEFCIILLFGQLELSNIMQSRRYYPRLYLCREVYIKRAPFLQCLKNDQNPKFCTFLPKGKFQHLLLHKAGWIF